jgi:hypothetical protein
VKFNAQDFRIPLPSPKIKSILFPRPGYYFQRASGRYEPDRYSHGGLSMAECMIPMIVLEAPKADHGGLFIDAIQQVGSVSEGEPLEIEIKVRSQKSVDPLTIAFSFSQSEIPERKEIFTGNERTYRVQWKPVLTEVNEADRDLGFVQISVTAIMSYRLKDQAYRISRTADVRVKLDPTRLRRRIDSKLDLMMGKMPKDLKLE